MNLKDIKYFFYLIIDELHDREMKMMGILINN